MINVFLDPKTGIAEIEPTDKLSKDDFVSVVKEIDPYIESNSSLRGILILSETFPGWDSFSSLIEHIKFIGNHHEHIGKVALCTDSVAGNLADHLASHFVSANIKSFSFKEIQTARAWLKQD